MTRADKLLFGGFIAFFAVFTLYPLIEVFRQALFQDGHISVGYFVNIINTPLMREAIWNSFMLAVGATGLCVVVALPLALLTHYVTFPGKSLLSGLLLIPLILPPFVGAIGMKQLLARFGTLNLSLMHMGLIDSPIDWLGSNRFWGVVIVMTLHLFPLVYLNLSSALSNLDPALVEAASALGSSPSSRFRRITLPLILPGLFAGATLVFVWALTDLGTPLIFEYRRVMAVQIFDRVTDMNSNPDGYALVVLVLVFTTALMMMSRRVVGWHDYHMQSKGVARTQSARSSRLTQCLAILTFVAVIGVALMPHAAVVLCAIKDQWFMTLWPESYTLEHLKTAMQHPLTTQGIRVSLFLSVLSTILDLALGITAAFLLARRTFRGRAWLDALIMLPLAVPGLVLAFGYLSGFSGTWLDARNNPLPLLVIAYAVRRLPYVFRAVHAGLLQISPSLEEAAVNLGSTRVRAIRRITLPLISSSVLAGAILAFAFAMLEVGDSLMLAMKEQFFPITKVMYQFIGRIEDGPELASALGLWAMAFLGLALLSATTYLGKRMGQIFRM